MSEQSIPHIPKTKQQYSKNAKVLKYKIQRLEQDIKSMRTKLSKAHSIDNDRILAMRFAKQCRIRRFTPQMVFRFADTNYEKQIDQTRFRSVLKSLGFDLSQDQVRKITLLIDEDLSGKLTYEQFVQYIEAFNINTETPQRTSVKGIKGITIKNISEIIGKDRMIDWEQFYKYMKEKFPLMKEKELIKIFNKLDPNNTGKISFAELKKLLEKLLSQEESGKKKEDKKSQKKKIQKKESKQSVIGGDTSSLQNKIHYLIKYRTTKSKLFHMTQLKKVGQKLNDLPGFIKLFKDIDTNKIGSFTIIDFIRYYLIHKLEKQSFKTAYELMNHKLYLENTTIQELLFTKGFHDNSEIKEFQFCNMLSTQFDVDEKDSKKMYKQILDQLSADSKKVLANNVVAKFKQAQRDLSDRPNPNNLISLNYAGTKQHNFYKKDIGSIVFSPLLALKFCLQLEEKMKKENRTQWMDPEFGVNNDDRTGWLSVTGRQQLDIDFGIDEDDLTWNTVQSLGMKTFYDNYSNRDYMLGKIQNRQFTSALTMLSQYFANILFQQIDVRNSIEKVTAKQLSSIFSGIRPKAFHHFQKYGIYVFRYFIQNRFVYVLVDGYIPTMTSKQIIFSHAKHSWISLIEKGYAKVQGSYANMLHRQSVNEILYELSHISPMHVEVPPEICNFGVHIQKRDAFWKNLLNIFKNNPAILISCSSSFKKGKLTCKGNQTDLEGDELVQVIYAFEIPNLKKPNECHQLLVLKLNAKKQFNDQKWNSTWSKFEKENTYDKSFAEIYKILRAQNNKVLEELKGMNNVILVDYQGFRSLYDRISYPENLQHSKWNSKMTLDRMLTETNTYVSQFRLESRMKTDVVLAFLKRVEKPGIVTIMFGEINKPPMTRVTSTEDFIFVKVQQIEANVEYIIYVYCKEEIIDFYLTFHLETKDFKVWKSNGPATFHDSKKLENQLCLEYENADPKVKQYLEAYLNVVKKEKTTGCCG